MSEKYCKDCLNSTGDRPEFLECRKCMYRNLVTGEFEPFCIEDTTVFPDSEKIYHRVCSPDLKPTSRITDLWTFRELPPDTQKTISKPIIYTRTPWWAHWYIEVPAGILVAYGGYRVGKATKQ